MKRILVYFIILSAIVVNSGCSSKLMSFEKRRYNKGYHVNFATKKDKRATASVTEKTVTLPMQEARELITGNNETAYSPLPELRTDSKFIEEQIPLASVAKTPEQKNTFFQNPILKYFTKEQIKKSTLYTFDKLMPKKNTTGTNQTMEFNIFTWLGALIAGGSLVALTVMLFSNWATVTLLILLVSGCFFGLILLIVGANT